MNGLSLSLNKSIIHLIDESLVDLISCLLYIISVSVWGWNTEPLMKSTLSWPAECSWLNTGLLRRLPLTRPQPAHRYQKASIRAGSLSRDDSHHTEKTGPSPATVETRSRSYAPTGSYRNPQGLTVQARSRPPRVHFCPPPILSLIATEAARQREKKDAK